MSITSSQITQQQTGFVCSLNGGRLDVVTPFLLQWKPIYHSTIGLWNGNIWVPYTPTNQVQIGIGEVDLSNNSLIYNSNYDVFMEGLSENQVRLVFNKWSSDNIRNPNLSRWDGVLVYDNSSNSGRKLRYLGTVRLESNDGPKFVDSGNKRFLVNFYNRYVKPVYTTNLYNGAWEVSTSNQWVEFRYGVSQVRGEFLSLASGVGLNGFLYLYKGYDDGLSWVGLGVNTTSGSNIASAVKHNSRQGTARHFTPTYGETLLGYNYITFTCKTNTVEHDLDARGGDSAGGYVWIEV